MVFQAKQCIQSTIIQLKGLGIYEVFESCSHFSGYVWSDWTAKTVQPMHVDDALQAMINQPARGSTGATMASSHPSTQPNVVMMSTENKGSGVSTLGVPPLNCQVMCVWRRPQTREPESLLTPPLSLRVSC